jgi:heme/copper-type cytochrome/quinol oxidase subunit 3
VSDTEGRRVSAVPASARIAKPNGWWGIAVFVATEATLFGTLVGSYFYLRFKNANWPPPGISPPDLAVPLILTAVLVTTSVPMQLASRAARAGRRHVAWLAIFLAFVVQAGYLAMQARLFSDDLDKLQPQGSAYGSIYFTLLGAHHTHVFVGLLLDLWLLLRIAQKLTEYRVTAVRAAVFYWHFVNVLALVVVGTQLSAPA